MSIIRLKDILVENNLAEGYFHVPEKVIEKIKNSYVNAYTRYKKSGAKKVSSSDFPPETFELDFSGTSFEFLNDLRPKPSVVITYVKRGGAAYKKVLGNKIEIDIGLEEGQRAIMDIIEHEILHAIQSLILVHVRNKMIKKYGNANYQEKFRKYLETFARLNPNATESDITRLNFPDIGGLPSKEYLPKDIDTGGFVIGSKSGKRVPHSRRPVEYYTDLLSSVRELHQLYYEKYHDLPDWEKIKNSENEKKKFFVKFMSAVNNDKKFGFIAGHVFSRFRKISNEFYRKMLAIAYNAFVNNPSNFDPARIIDPSRIADLLKSMDIGDDAKKKTGEESGIEGDDKKTGEESGIEGDDKKIFKSYPVFKIDVQKINLPDKNKAYDYYGRYSKILIRYYINRSALMRKINVNTVWGRDLNLPIADVAPVFKNLSEMKSEDLGKYVSWVSLNRPFVQGIDKMYMSRYRYKEAVLSNDVNDIQNKTGINNLLEYIVDNIAKKMANEYYRSARDDRADELKLEINFAYGKKII